MPQLDLKYSNDLTDIDFVSLFQAIEELINHLDPSAGACKSRAYPTTAYLHTHVYLHLQLLKKPHRDASFMQNCSRQLEMLLKTRLPVECFYAIDVTFASEYYITNQQF